MFLEPYLMGLVGKGAMCWLRWLCVVELAESFCNVPRHGEMDFEMCIVPVEMDVNVMVSVQLVLRG